jgi:hypothetical protein
MCRTARSVRCVILSFAVAACGGEPATSKAVEVPLAAPTPPAAKGAATAATAPPAVPEAPAHKLFVEANACWFGGIWSDAERDVPEARRGVVEARCRDVLRTVYGNDDKTRLEQLRAFEGSVVGDLAAKVETIAANDPKEAPHKEMLAKLVISVAAAQREAMEARRAADRVKRDLDHEPEKLTKDESEAIAPLLATKDLAALLALDAGDLAADARAIGFIIAMDHVALSRGLPKHLKVYALSGTLKSVFDATPPADMPTDATKPLKKGTYLAYLTEVAKLAGHPVPETAKTLRHREGLAWAGILEGIGQKIKANAEKLAPDTELYAVSLRIANRLTAWYEAEKSAVVAAESKDGKGSKPKK